MMVPDRPAVTIAWSINDEGTIVAIAAGAEVAKIYECGVKYVGEDYRAYVGKELVYADKSTTLFRCHKDAIYECEVLLRDKFRHVTITFDYSSLPEWCM